MRAIETEQVAAGDTWEALMDRAGERVAESLVEWWGDRPRPNVLCIAGPGNNGGDALVVARLLTVRGWPVRLLTLKRDPTGDGRLQQPLKDLNVRIEALPPFSGAELDALFDWCDVIVDGVFGTGLQRDVTGDLAGVLARAASSGKPVVGVDIPSGIDSDTGSVRGAALPCDITVTLGSLKYGHLQYPGKGYSGRVYVGDIGLSNEITKQKASGELLSDKSVAALLPARPDDSNKGTFGKAMIVAGSINYIGAAALAVQGAMRSGAGLVTLGCAVDLLPILAAKLTECTYLPLATELGVVSDRAVDKLEEKVQGYSSLLIGCGLGTEKETAAFIHTLMTQTQRKKPPTSAPIGFALPRSDKKAEGDKEKQFSLPPLVLDGDALNILAEWDEWPKQVPANTVLTPHPGEMARLLKSTVDDVQSDRASTAQNAAKEWGMVVVLKGAGTVIAAPTGKIHVSPFANPVLATAGSGDVLAGCIAGLLAQGLSPVDAACAGVYLHGMAGEMLRDELGASGGLAGDLPRLLPLAQRRLREGQ